MVEGGDLAEGARLLRAGVDLLLGASLTTPDSAGLVEALDELEVQRRRLEAVDQRLVAELGERYVAGEFGATGTAALLMQRLRVSPGEAKARVARARDLGPRRAVSGEQLEPLLPATSAAVADGAISAAGHGAVITRVLDRVPADLPGEAVAVAEAFLVQAARHQHPQALARTGELLLARLDPDGRAPRDEEIQRRRDVTVVQHANGSAAGRVQLTAACAAAVQTVLDALSAPCSTQDADGNEIRDPRTAGQRRHDALHEAMLRLLRSGDLPAAGGVPVTILALASITDLAAQLPLNSNNNAADADDTAADDTADRAGEVFIDTAGARTGTDLCPAADTAAALTGTVKTAATAMSGLGGGVAVTGHGAIITLQQLLDMATDADIIPIYCNDTGGILAYGRAKRLAARGQRLVLAARDRGCVMPGCDRPPAWTEVHHIIPWAPHGLTDIDNLCLLSLSHESRACAVMILVWA
ncbi:DUF222 domain-containing protein, partial [uncultured Jatrophihabitans sp.]|uniref:HNH endonuclease signature motif containing protein n=1 Tax=uncultured Jatrophihabitans sp. TaxID=1610747 RepID=UPI0035CC63C7